MFQTTNQKTMLSPYSVLLYLVSYLEQSREEIDVT